MKIKNTKLTADTWVGQEIQPNTYYSIEPFEQSRWANSSKVLSDIGSGDLLYNDEIQDITDVATAISLLKGSEVSVRQLVPDYAQTKYLSVASSTTDESGGVVIPNLQKIGISRFRGNGSDPNAYFVLVWDWEGAAQKIIASTRGDIDVTLNSAAPENQLTGDGVKKLNIILVNDSTISSQIIGGSWEAIKV